MHSTLQHKWHCGLNAFSFFLFSFPYLLCFFSWQLGSRDEVAKFAAPPSSTPGTNAFNCCSTRASGAERTVVGGTESGHIAAWDLRTLTQPLRILLISVGYITSSLYLSIFLFPLSLHFSTHARM
jgi:hypothetical protein